MSELSTPFNCSCCKNSTNLFWELFQQCSTCLFRHSFSLVSLCTCSRLMQGRLFELLITMLALESESSMIGILLMKVLSPSLPRTLYSCPRPFPLPCHGVSLHFSTYVSPVGTLQKWNQRPSESALGFVQASQQRGVTPHQGIHPGSGRSQKLSCEHAILQGVHWRFQDTEGSL